MADPHQQPIAWDVHTHLVPVVPDLLASIDGVVEIDGKLQIDGHLLKVDDLFEPSRLGAVGYGEYRPVEDNSYEDGRSRNRRVVIVIGPARS